MAIGLLSCWLVQLHADRLAGDGRRRLGDRRLAAHPGSTILRFGDRVSFAIQ